MKSCPQCNQTYNDETLNFCLNDGAMLVQVFNQGQNAATVMMNQPRNTANQQPVFNNQPKQQTYGSVQPRKKSRAWIWILGILGVLGLGGIVILVALIGLFASIPTETDHPNNGKTVRKTPEATPSRSDDDVVKDDLSNWKYDNPNFGNTTYSGNELTMTSKAGDYYFMLTTPDNDFQTANAISKVTVKNVSGKSSNLGFGLLIHCDEDTPGKKDYAFLIDSNARKFRIGKHTLTKESNIISWTNSTAINTGTEYNELEVKDENGTMSFYINGDLVRTIKDTENNKSGIVGLYVGGGIPIAFSNLEIRK